MDANITSNPAGSPVIRSRQQPEPNEFDRFTDLTRKLVKVPKRELDDQRNAKP